jgi:GNAT superfamily N-acetyltransferase
MAAIHPWVLTLDAAAAKARRERLADILIDAVEGGASINFLLPFERQAALAYWDRIIAAIAAGQIHLFAIEDPDRIIGTVQLVPAPQPNQAHRADIAKLLVARSARRKGLGQVLMKHVEEKARPLGRTLLTLETETGGPAEALYRGMGYQPFGVVPHHARRPNGQLADTIFFFKHLDDGPGIGPQT